MNFETRHPRNLACQVFQRTLEHLRANGMEPSRVGRLYKLRLFRSAEDVVSMRLEHFGDGPRDWRIRLRLRLENAVVFDTPVPTEMDLLETLDQFVTDIGDRRAERMVELGPRIRSAHAQVERRMLGDDALRPVRVPLLPDGYLPSPLPDREQPTIYVLSHMADGTRGRGDGVALVFTCPWMSPMDEWVRADSEATWAQFMLDVRSRIGAGRYMDANRPVPRRLEPA